MVAAGVACLVTAALAWRHLSVPGSADLDLEGEPRDSLQNAGAWGIVAPRYLLGTLMLWALFISMLTISYCLNSWLPTLLVDVGRDERFAALSVSVFSLGGIVSALGIGALIDRFGAIRTLVSALLVSTVLLYVTGQALETASAGMLMALLAASGFFVLGSYGGVNVVLATFYPAAIRAPGIGWAKSVGRLGTVLAPILIGAALTAGIRETTVMSLFAVPAILAALCLLVIGSGMRTRS
jgi:MFS family permease